MEFEEMQKVWHSQSNQMLYAFDERALANRISTKKNEARRITNLSELVVIFTYLVGSIFILITSIVNALENVFMYLLSAWMGITAVYAIYVRFKRLHSKIRFHLSMSGELDHALSLAAHQVRFSEILLWNSLPIAVLTLLAVLNSNKSMWIAAGVFVFFAATYVMARLEVRYYKRRRTELEQLKLKLERE